MRIVTKRYKIIALVGALALSVAAMGLLYAQQNHSKLNGSLGGKDTRPSVASDNLKDSEGVTHSPESGIAGPAMDEESRRERFKEWVKSQESFAGPANTSQALAFKLKFPKSAALGQPVGVYVEKQENKDDRVAYIYYGDPVDGISVMAGKFPEKIDFKTWVGEQEKNKKADILKANNTPFLIDVNGREGWGWEPGYNVINGNEMPKNGFVQWQEDDGVTYNISGTWGPDGTSVQELLEIARTMSE